MGRRKKERTLVTNIEAKRAFDDRAASIDKELDEALQNIDWKRRKQAEQSLPLWVKTYMCNGLALADEPPERGNSVLSQMQNALTSHKNYLLAMGRGSGKSSYCICATLYAIATGIQKYVVIISNNARAAGGLMQDLWRVVAETGTAFAQDYPELVLPFQICQGSFRRRQLYKGISTDIQKNAGNIVFPRIQDENGIDYPTSGSIVTCRGISSGLRGMKKGVMRPTLCLLDDLQSTETAESPEAVEKLINIIRKDVFPLGGKQRLSILQTATPIVPDDAVERMMNDKAWITTLYPAVIAFPKNMDLWKQYFAMYDAESVSDGKHVNSLKFYKENKEKMDEGSEVFNPTRYAKEDGHISAIQKLLEMRHVIGEAAFASEFQMKPMKYTMALDITPKIVCSKVGKHKMLEVPDGTTFVACATDLNVSYALTTSIVAFKRDMTAYVIWHGIKKSRIDQKQNDTAYNQDVYNILCELGRELKQMNVKIDGWAIDAGGRNWDAVCQFANNAMQVVGLPACAFAGRAATIFNPYVRSRLRDAVGRTVLCGNAAEHVKSGSGQKYIFFDADLYKEMAQKAFISQLGNIGSCQLYDGSADEHSDFAIQFCNEQLKHVRHRQDGRSEYTWKTKEPHDFLDTMSMCYAVASSQGISGSIKQTGVPKVVQRAKPRIKIV